jgi:hypothetical protein
MLAFARALVILPVALASPPHWKKPETARWMATTLDWGFLSTTSTRSDGSTVGDPFGNPYSFAVASTGVPYLFASMLDASMIDAFDAKAGKPRASLALSEAQITNPDIVTRQYCSIGTFIGDPENPPCARLVLSGTVVKLEANSSEDTAARKVLFQRHPSFAEYPPSHDFFVAKLDIDGVWLIDFYGGAAIIPPAQYFGAEGPLTGPTAVLKAQVLAVSPPPYQNKAATARWMANSLVWGVLSTTSTRSEATRPGDAFGNPNSFADVDGVPYLYVSNDDASMIDVFVAKSANPRVSLALSEATLSGTPLARPDCTIGAGLGDPENPPCARLVLSGKIVRVAANSTEEQVANAALFKKHPSFPKYPKDHAFFTAKLEVDGVWLIDFYGGAANIKPAEYFAASPSYASSLVV